jgi:putative ABC transport system permease protein
MSSSLNGMQLVGLSLTMLRRDWRAGEIKLLLSALVIAVASITTVGFFTDRIERGMQLQAAELLAGDLVVSSSSPISNAYRQQAQALGLQTTQTLSFRSMAVAGELLQLVEVKAVSPGYPLRGTLRIAETPFGADRPAKSIPQPGSVWVDQKALQLLQLQTGDRLQLGELSLVIASLVTYEPDRGGDFFTLGPRVMMNSEDVAATGLLGQGSRAEYRLLVAGEREGVALLRRQLKGKLQSGEKILEIESGRPEIGLALQRANSFLGLAALISVLLAGVAIAMMARRHAQRHFDTSAIMLCLGAQQNTILRLYLLELLWIALLGSSVGVFIGILGQQVLAGVMQGLILAKLPPPGWEAAVVGLASGIVAVLGFALPPISVLAQVPPLRVLRREVAPMSVSKVLLYGAAAAAMVLLIAWQVRDAELLLLVVAGALAATALLVSAAWLLLYVLGPLRSRVGVSWRFGVANIVRHRQDSIAQIVALGLGILVLLLLTLVRTDLLADWRNSLPGDAPNHFLINIQTDQVDALDARLAQLSREPRRIYPMVRARLTAINGVRVNADDYDDPRSRRLATREFNLSWSAALQQDNQTVAGSWWGAEPQGRALLSLELSISKALGVNIGDVMTFQVNGSPLDLEVSHLRNVQWDSFNVNFFALTPPGLLDRYPASWITSVHIPQRQRGELPKLIRAFPNVTLIDVEALMNRVRVIMERVSTAVEFIFIFTLLAGFLVLYAVIQTQQDARKQHHALLRTLGASRRQLMRGLISEFLVLGGLAGLLAGVAVTGLHWILAVRVFDLSFSVNPWIALAGIISGALGAALLGAVGARKSLDAPPIEILRG